MGNVFTKIFMDERLPFLELRHSSSNPHYKKHFHETFSLGVNKRGTSLYTNGENTYTLRTNGLSIMNPLAVHSCNIIREVQKEGVIHNDSDSNVDAGSPLNEYFVMYLDTAWCRDIQRVINETVTTFVPLPVEFMEHEGWYTEYIALCEYLFADHPLPDKEDALLSFFLAFFAQFITADDAGNNEADAASEQDNSAATLRAVTAYMDAHYAENITLEELAEQFAISPFYLIRLFTKHLQVTPRAYLLNVKVNKARELLQRGYSIVDTALECGFYDQSHFHKHFVKIVATTPKAYQRNFVQ